MESTDTEGLPLLGPLDQAGSLMFSYFRSMWLLRYTKMMFKKTAINSQ